MKIHTASHDLPISGGYGANDGKISVYCGRCGGSYAVTSSWAVRYLESHATRLRREIDRGFLDRANGREMLEENARRFRRGGLDVTAPEL